MSNGALRTCRARVSFVDSSNLYCISLALHNTGLHYRLHVARQLANLQSYVGCELPSALMPQFTSASDQELDALEHTLADLRLDGSDADADEVDSGGRMSRRLM
jgi:hypothetical protein